MRFKATGLYQTNVSELAARVLVPTRGTKFKEAASLDAAFYVLKRLVCTKPMSQPKNWTLLCPVPSANQKSHERVRGLLNFETTG
ncbi:hypothetical protein BTO10_17070 [Vibrio chagasii]|uniref:Uncharacterized protein n=1 Tax=Vibrio chagasii TaxID=170679 RepID=A0A2S7VFS4_9VIBR|nr:hypothetical protein BTO10_17070 [Vibrio chagasii]